MENLRIHCEDMDHIAPWLTKNSTSIFHRFVDLFVLHLFGDSSDSKKHCRHQWRKTNSPACHMSTLTVESWKSAWNFAWILFVHSVLQISCQWPAVDTLAEQSFFGGWEGYGGYGGPPATVRWGTWGTNRQVWSTEKRLKNWSRPMALRKQTHGWHR